MSELPYFQFYVGDYDRKTAHLSALEDGMYFRLLRICWTSPCCKIPADDAWIMRKTRARTDEEQAAVRAVISEFFTKARGKIWNDRLLQEFVNASQTHAKRSDAGKSGVAAKSLKTKETRSSRAKAGLEPGFSKTSAGLKHTSEGHKEIDDDEDTRGSRETSPPLSPDIPADPSQPKPDGMTLREQLLAICGADPVSGLTGEGGRMIGRSVEMAEITQIMHAHNLTEDEVVGVVREQMVAKRAGRDPSPPTTLGYFRKTLLQFAAAKAAQPPALPQFTPSGGSTDARSARQLDNAERMQRIALAAAHGSTDGPDFG